MCSNSKDCPRCITELVAILIDTFSGALHWLQEKKDSTVSSACGLFLCSGFFTLRPLGCEQRCLSLHGIFCPLHLLNNSMERGDISSGIITVWVRQAPLSRAIWGRALQCWRRLRDTETECTVKVQLPGGDETAGNLEEKHCGSVFLIFQWELNSVPNPCKGAAKWWRHQQQLFCKHPQLYTWNMNHWTRRCNTSVVNFSVCLGFWFWSASSERSTGNTIHHC